MFGPNVPIADSPLPSRAVLVGGGQTTREERNIIRILDFFAIPWKAAMACDGDVDRHGEPYAILISAEHMAQAIEHAQDMGTALPPWVSKASSVYVHSFQSNDRSTKLLRRLTGNPQAKVTAIQARETTATIAGDFPEMCGPMSGMRVPIMLRAPGCVCDTGLGREAFRSVVRVGEGEAFFGLTCSGVPFYLNSWDRTVDISALAPEYFDVKKSFCESIPLIFYLRWAFRDVAWRQAETSAALIVDDPPLKRRYGFLDFREALDLMRDHNFATTIAFIPWNWQRTHASTLSLFQNEPERFSLVVHGCDHTASEFAVRSSAVLNRKIRASRQRMGCFRRRASIKADRVMVFPQGQFSPEAVLALKLNGFIAAVNTEVAPALGAINETRISDLWDIAIMRYATFPIFTRRYAGHGIENFAFDALLGKPCLITAHHEVFRDHGRNLVDFIERLNSLRWNLVWRPLGQAIRRSFTIGRLDHETSVIHMFSSSVAAENVDAQIRKTLFLKEEGDADCVQAVWVNNKRVEFSVKGEHLRVWRTMLPHETANVRVVYRKNLEAIAERDGFGVNIRVAAKRYLSEFRDTYLSRNDFLFQSANRLKHLVK